jgi:hypothetical protein
MRLKDSEVQAIVAAFRPLLTRVGGELFLFGSRVIDTKKGGDIDLLAVVPEAQIDAVVGEKARLRDSIQRVIGEQRIDVTVASPEKMKSDAFLLSIADSIVLPS